MRAARAGAQDTLRSGVRPASGAARPSTICLQAQSASAELHSARRVAGHQPAAPASKRLPRARSSSPRRQRAVLDFLARLGSCFTCQTRSEHPWLMGVPARRHTAGLRPTGACTPPPCCRPRKQRSPCPRGGVARQARRRRRPLRSPRRARVQPGLEAALGQRLMLWRAPAGAAGAVTLAACVGGQCAPHPARRRAAEHEASHWQAACRR